MQREFSLQPPEQPQYSNLPSKTLSSKKIFVFADTIFTSPTMTEWKITIFSMFLMFVRGPNLALVTLMMWRWLMRRPGGETRSRMRSEQCSMVTRDSLSRTRLSPYLDTFYLVIGIVIKRVSSIYTSKHDRLINRIVRTSCVCSSTADNVPIIMRLFMFLGDVRTDKMLNSYYQFHMITLCQQVVLPIFIVDLRQFLLQSFRFFLQR